MYLPVVQHLKTQRVNYHQEKNSSKTWCMVWIAQVSLTPTSIFLVDNAFFIIIPLMVYTSPKPVHHQKLLYKCVVKTPNAHQVIVLKLSMIQLINVSARKTQNSILFKNVYLLVLLLELKLELLLVLSWLSLLWF